MDTKRRIATANHGAASSSSLRLSEVVGRVKRALSVSMLGDSLTRISVRFSRGMLDFIEDAGTKKLKVALVSYYYQKPSDNGVAIHVQNLALYLARHGCEVHVFCHGRDDAHYREDGVLVHAIGGIFTPMDNRFSKTKLQYDLFESEAIKEIIRENSYGKFDIVHSHGSLTKAAFIVKKVSGIKWVHTFHAIERMRIQKLSDEEKQFEDLVSWIEHTVNYCDGAIFVSGMLLKDSRALYDLRSKVVIPNGINLGLFKYHPIVNKNVLYVGRFSIEKGIDMLPELILAVMAVEGATFTALAPYRIMSGRLMQIRERIRKLEERYGGRVRIITEPKSHEEVELLYRDCQVYVQPSGYESFGLSILEAMANGRPVVAFRVGGIPEVIGGAGYLVRDKRKFVRKVKELLENRDECIRTGNKASKRARGFGWDAIAKKTIKYYGEVMG